MHYWGYLMERLLDGESARTTGRSHGSRRETRGSGRGGRAWSRTAPWH
jgi:hypothetical protein